MQNFLHNRLCIILSLIFTMFIAQSAQSQNVCVDTIYNHQLSNTSTLSRAIQESQSYLLQLKSKTGELVSMAREKVREVNSRLRNRPSVFDSINEVLRDKKESMTLATKVIVDQLRSEGVTVYNFGLGQSAFQVHHSLRKALQKKENAGNKNYLPTLGAKPVRIAIADYLNKTLFSKEGRSDSKPIDFNDIIVGPGSKELLYYTQVIFSNQKTELVLAKASWVSYGPQADIVGKKTNWIDTKIENGFKVEADELDRAFSKVSRRGKKPIFILNTPNNPTGKSYSAAEMIALAEVARKHDAIILHDAIYSYEKTFDGERTPMMRNYYPEGTYTTYGLSKVDAAGGYRLGYLILPDFFAAKDRAPKLSHKTKVAIRAAYQVLMSETISSVAAPIQFATKDYYEGADKSGLSEFLRYKLAIERAASLYAWQRAGEMGIDTGRPDGGFYIGVSFLKYKNRLRSKGIKTSAELLNTLLNQHHVAFVPGEEFGFRGEELFARLSIVDFDGTKILNEVKKSRMTIEELESLQPNDPALTEFADIHFSNVVSGFDAIKNFLLD